MKLRGYRAGDVEISQEDRPPLTDLSPNLTYVARTSINIRQTCQ